MGREMRWWGWGEDARAEPSPAHVWTWMRERLGALDAPHGPVALEDVALDEPRLPASLRQRFAAILRDDRAARVAHARGKSYPDLVRQRAGDCADAPDAVLTPRDHDEARAVVEACAAAGVAIVPFGGGTSAVGGLEPLREGFAALVSLDMGGVDAVDAIDERSQVAVVGAGIRAVELEAHLGARGLSLGHVPQSFEHVSIGGCVATRSAGQGRIDDLVLGARLAAPAGELELPAQPASAAGPDLRRLVIGSEGALGAITCVTLRVRATPAVSRQEGWMFPSLGAGAEALRRLAQDGLAPDIASLSDEEDTRMGLALAGVRGLRDGALRAYLRTRGVAAGAMAILGWQGSEGGVRVRHEAAVEVLRDAGGIALGRLPARAWARRRFRDPYLRDELIDRGVLVATLETAATWGRLLTVHRAVGDALSVHAPVVACRVSNAHPTGASLCFTVLAPARRAEELDQWAAIKAAGSEAILATGATITHHHAVGTMHAPYLRAEIGDTGAAALRALKRELDPTGVMNPGKLIPPAG